MNTVIVPGFAAPLLTSGKASKFRFPSLDGDTYVRETHGLQTGQDKIFGNTYTAEIWRGDEKVVEIRTELDVEWMGKTCRFYVTRIERDHADEFIDGELKQHGYRSVDAFLTDWTAEYGLRRDQLAWIVTGQLVTGDEE